MLVIKMGIARGRLVVGMTEQPSDHRQRFLVHRGMAGECVAQVVDAQLAEANALYERRPDVMDGPHRLAVTIVPEQPGYLGMPRQAVDHLACGRAEPDRARARLAVAQVQTIALHVLPLQARDLIVAAAG